MATNNFRSAGITKAIENAKYMVEKVENPFKEVWLQNMFFLQTYEATTWLIFFLFLNFSFLTTFPTQRHSTRLWYNKSDFFFKISFIWFVLRRKNNW